MKFRPTLLVFFVIFAILIFEFSEGAKIKKRKLVRKEKVDDDVDSVESVSELPKKKLLRRKKIIKKKLKVEANDDGNKSEELEKKPRHLGLASRFTTRKQDFGQYQPYYDDQTASSSSGGLYDISARDLIALESHPDESLDQPESVR